MITIKLLSNLKNVQQSLNLMKFNFNHTSAKVCLYSRSKLKLLIVVVLI